MLQQLDHTSGRRTHHRRVLGLAKCCTPHTDLLLGHLDLVAKVLAEAQLGVHGRLAGEDAEGWGSER